MSERPSLFISHATLQDNAFAVWLGAKLAASGYKAWAGFLRLKGGDDWQRKFEDHEYQIPRVSNPSTDAWSPLQAMHGRKLEQRPERLTSNWLRVRKLPENVFS